MGKIALMISLDVLKFKIEKSLQQFGLNETMTIGHQMLSLSLAKLTSDDIDLIIIDIDNPDQDAIDVIRKLKSSKKTKLIPIIAIGNTTDKTTTNKLILSGCIEYFSKPLDDMTFVGKIHSLIKEFRDAHSTNPTQVDSFAENEPKKVESINESTFIDVKFTWNPIFETGVEFIDRDHLKIIEEYEKLYKLMKNGNGHEFCKDLLDFLDNYIDTHFSAEEAYMNASEYPDRENHFAKHQYFIDKVIKLKVDLVYPVTNEDLIKINLFIKEWLIQHILYEDQKMTTYIKKHKTDMT